MAEDGLESVGGGSSGGDGTHHVGSVAGTEEEGSLAPAAPPPPTAHEFTGSYPALQGGGGGGSGWHLVCRRRLRILPLDATTTPDDVTVPVRFQLHLPCVEARPYFKMITTETQHPPQPTETTAKKGARPPPATLVPSTTTVHPLLTTSPLAWRPAATAARTAAGSEGDEVV